MTSDPDNTFLSDAQLEARWGRKPGYCAELRSRGAGPKFVRLSPRVIRYRLSAVQEHEQTNTFRSTAELLAADDNDGDPKAA
jgi:hypothetical protein